MSATDYILEFRKRLIQISIAIFLLFCFFYYASQNLLFNLALPLLNRLSMMRPIIATDIASVFFVPIKLAFFASLLVGMPFIFYQLWTFISPALYKKEKKTIAPLLFLSVFLFYLGVLFAYFVSLPLILNFLVKVAPSIVEIRPDIQKYIDFVFGLFFAFGLGFQTPLVIFLVVQTNLTTPDALKKNRPYIIVAVLTVSMLLTPPDVISQVLLAIPILLLFELGLILVRFKRR